MSDAFIVSDSKDNVSLSEFTDTVVSSDSTNDTNPDWIHFLEDHYNYIKSTCQQVTLTESVMLRYNYRIRDYLDDVIGGRHDVETAFRIINNLAADTDFTLKLSTVYIPSAEIIRQLYRAYLTQKTRIDKL